MLLQQQLKLVAESVLRERKATVAVVATATAVVAANVAEAVRSFDVTAHLCVEHAGANHTGKLTRQEGIQPSPASVEHSG